jgi:hypothetical protein
MTCGEFVGGLLHAVTVAHVMHLKATGPGSYARHMALGDLYDGLGDLTDSLAESYQGAYGLIDDYPASFAMPDKEPLAWLKELSRFVQEGRKALPDDSEIQNQVDEIQGLVNSAHYKLAFLE